MSRRLLDASDAREPPNRVEPGIGFFVPEAPIPSWASLASSRSLGLSSPAAARTCRVWVPGRQLAGEQAPTAIQWQLQLWLNPFSPRELQPNLTSRL